MKYTPSLSYIITTILFAVVLLSRCTALTPVVQNDYNRTANFGQYRTFSWYPVDSTAIPATATETLNPVVDQRVRAAVESELLKRGLIPATTNAPDLLLAYDIAVTIPGQTTDDNAGFGYGYSYWYGYRFNYNHEGVPSFRNIRNYPAGTVVVDLVDPSSNELVWRGWTESHVGVTGVGEIKISRAVARVIAQYPPGGQIQQGRYHQGR